MDIANWLRTLGLAQYESAFRENEVDAEVLRQLTVDDLKDLGVAAVGHRRRLITAIAKLQGDTAAAQPVAELISENAVPAPAAERRHITVLFCDIVGSTALSARLDPEELCGMLNAYQVAVAKEIADKGGYVARFVGDGVLAYFGWPNPDETHAESAVRAGLAIIEAIGAQQLSVRIGAATGLVVTGDLVGVGAAQTMTAVGDTPNLAARMQALAEPNTVVVSDATRVRLDALFEWQDLGLVALKGFDEPVRAWWAQRKTETASRSEAVYTNLFIPLVGRNDELDLLLRRWQRAKAGAGEIVLVSGEAGIGKSRLLAAFEEQLGHEPRVSLRYFCSPYHQNSPLHPVITRLEQQAGFIRGDSTEERLQKLRAVLAPSAPTMDDIAPLLPLMAITVEEHRPTPMLTPQRQMAQTLAALRRYLIGLARRGPVLVLFEDAHWSDPTSLELLDSLVEQVPDLPMLLITAFRPDFKTPWLGRPHVTLIALGRLDRRDAAALATRVVADHMLSPDLQEQIVARAEGVPLFIEEMTKATVESGLPEGSAASSAGTKIPANLYDSLMARLDRLPEGREVAQIGAVIGREFSHDMLYAIAGRSAKSLDAALKELLRSELVFRSGTPPDIRYRFKHILVQQATYETLLRSRRQDLHARVAKAIAERFPDEPADQAHLLLHHATLAGDDALAAHVSISAAERSLQNFAPEEAYRLAERGLVHLDRLAGGEQQVLARIRLLKIKTYAGVHRHRDEAPALMDHLREAADAAVALGLHGQAIPALDGISYLQQWLNDTRGAGETTLRAEETSRKADETTQCHQIANTGRCLLEVEQQTPRALALVEEAEALARTLDLNFVELKWARAHAARWRGDLEQAHALMSEATTLARQREERWREVECLIWLAMIGLERRDLSAVERLCDEIDAIARRLDHAFPPVSAAFRVLAQLGTREADLTLALDQAVTALRDFDDKAHLAYVLNFAADHALSQGRYRDADIAAGEALTTAKAMPRATEVAVATAILARIECAGGNRAAAIARIHALVSDCDFSNLSARARTNLQRATDDINVAVEFPPANKKDDQPNS
jgi:class 3 adenylate cyclase